MFRPVHPPASGPTHCGTARDIDTSRWNFAGRGRVDTSPL